MPEEDIKFSSKIKYKGIFSFKELYLFCYDWITEETDLKIEEKKYSEKITEDSKEIKIKWEGIKKLTDYFKFLAKVEFHIIGLTEVEIQNGGAKLKTNKGLVEIKIKGTLIKDYEGKFEKTATKKFLRSIYEKWVIPARVEEFEDKIIEKCDEFLNQTKAFLDLEGKK